MSEGYEVLTYTQNELVDADIEPYNFIEVEASVSNT